MCNICFLNHFAFGPIHLFFYYLALGTPLGVFHGGMCRQYSTNFNSLVSIVLDDLMQNITWACIVCILFCVGLFRIVHL